MPKRKDYSQIMITEFAKATNKEMRDVYNKLIKTANERIRVTAAEKNIAHASAYKNIVQPLKGAGYVKQNKRGETVFKAIPKTASRAQIIQALQKAQQFIQSKTSTVKGINEVIEMRRASIKEQIPGISNKEADEVLKWLGSEEGKKAKEAFDSDELKIVMSKAAKSGKSSLQEQWEAFKERRASIGESLADWDRQLSGTGEVF